MDVAPLGLPSPAEDREIAMQMMRTLMSGVFSIALLGASTAAVAVTLGEVGGVDDLVAADNISPNETSETEFLAGLLGVDPATLEYEKFEMAFEGDGWVQVTGGAAGTDLWAFDFGTLQPLAFLIKTGAGVCLVDATGIVEGDGSDASSCPTTYDTYGYLNLVSLNWAVIDLALFDRTQGNVEIGVVSHISAGGAGDPPGNGVPEPGSLVLLGISLAALTLFRRRRGA